MKKGILTKHQFKSIYTKVPRICVEVIIIRNKKILLSKRSINPFKSFWHFPGSGVLYKEKISETVKRTAKKELGIKIVSQKFLGYMETLHDGYRHSVSLVFKCKISGNKNPKPLEQSSEIGFFSKIPKRTVPMHNKFIKKNWKEIFK